MRASERATLFEGAASVKARLADADVETVRGFVGEFVQATVKPSGRGARLPVSERVGLTVRTADSAATDVLIAASSAAGKKYIETGVPVNVPAAPQIPLHAFPAEVVTAEGYDPEAVPAVAA